MTALELITLTEAALLIPGADAGTLKRRIRNGQLRAWRPGRKYLTTRAAVLEMVEMCRIVKKPVRPTPAAPKELRLTEMDLASAALDAALAAHRKGPSRR